MRLVRSPNFSLAKTPFIDYNHQQQIEGIRIKQAYVTHNNNQQLTVFRNNY